MISPQLPEILKEKLVFGDDDQINALRDYEKRSEAHYLHDNEKKFHVYVEVEYSETITVLARSEKEAIEKAKEEFDTFGLDLDVSFNAKEV